LHLIAHNITHDCIICVFVYHSGACNSASCLNGGHCMGEFSQICACPAGFQGTRCQYGKSSKF